MKEHTMAMFAMACYLGAKLQLLWYCLPLNKPPLTIVHRLATGSASDEVAASPPRKLCHACGPWSWPRPPWSLPDLREAQCLQKRAFYMRGYQNLLTTKLSRWPPLPTAVSPPSLSALLRTGRLKPPKGQQSLAARPHVQEA